MNDLSLKILDLLAQHEELISELYKTYAEKLPEYSKFWSGVANEEIIHANYIKSLKDKVIDGSVIFDDKRFKTAAIETSISYVKKEISFAHANEITPVRAFSIGMDYENSLLEKDWFNIFEGDSEELKNLFSTISEETKSHHDQMKKMKENI